MKKLLFGAAAAGLIAWLVKNKETAKSYADRYGGKLKSAAPGTGRGWGGRFGWARAVLVV